MNYAATAALALALSLAAGATYAADAQTKAVTPQQQRMKDCNVQATGKHGDERKAFMSTCLKGNASAAAATAKPAASKSKSGAGAGKH
ncbi:MAG TPA: PsiF family protein [Rhodanobacteraceae bacterium]|nr:PsiF family protein [Rhodanobacteraceae bacterium]